MKKLEEVKIEYYKYKNQYRTVLEEYNEYKNKVDSEKTKNDSIKGSNICI